MIIGDVDVSQCEYLKERNTVQDWGIGKEYSKDYKCTKFNNGKYSCKLYDECEYKRCKRLNDFLKELENDD